LGTLYIDRKGLHIRLDGQALSFYFGKNREGSAPIRPLQRVVVVGDVQIDASALHRLGELGIHVLFVGGKSHAFKGIFRGHLHKNALLRVGQYDLSRKAFAADFAREQVRKKVAGQRRFLQEALQRRHDLRKPLFDALSTLERVEEKLSVAGSMSRDTLMGLEGGAAAAYFRAYTKLFPPSLGFTKRVRRPPTDPVNALLSLGYTLLHFEAVREVEMIGLDPCIGFLHEFEYGRESLACDFVEAFRPGIDGWVWILFRERTFDAAYFSSGGERPGCYLKKEGRRKFYGLYEEFMDEVRPRLVRSVRDLARRIQDGQDTLPE